MRQSPEINPVTLEGTTEVGAEVTLDGVTVTADASGHFEFDEIELALGANEFELTVTDAAGNSGTVRQTVVREAADGMAPEVTVALVTDSGIVGDLVTNAPALQGQVTDSSVITSLVARLNGGPLSDVTDVLQGDGSFVLSAERLAQIHGGSLPEGSLTVELQAVDERGNLSDFLSYGFTLDTTGPMAIFGLASRFDTPPVGDGVTESNPVTLEGTTEPGSEVTLGGVTVTADGNGHFEFDGIELALGTNAFELTVVDEAGNTGTTSQTVVREAADGDAPSVTVGLVTDSGVVGDRITNIPTLEGQVSDDSEIVSLVARLNGGALAEVNNAVQDDGSFVLDGARLAQLNGGILTDGELTVELQAVDERGNLSDFISYTFTLDTGAPNAIFGLASDFDTPPVGDGETTLSTVTLSGQTEAGARVVLRSTGAEAIADDDGAFQFTGVELALGDNGFEIDVIDAAGNQRRVQQTVSRVEPAPVDSSAPVIVAALVNDTGRSSSDRLTSDAAISGTVSDESAIDRFVLRLNGSTTLVEVGDRLDASGNFQFSTADLEALFGSLSDGTNTIHFQAVDAEGLVSDPIQLDFTLDRSAPTVNVGLDSVADPNGDGTTDQETATVVGQTEAGASVDWVEPGRSATADSTGQFQFENSALTLGNNPVTLQVIDEAGNRTDLSQVFVRVEPVLVDNEPPTITPNLANDTGSSSTDRLTSDASLVGQVVDTSGITSLTLQIDGLGGAVEILEHLDSAGNFSLSTEQLNGIYGDVLPDGSHEVVLQATDEVGNESQPVSFNFVLDTTPPNLSGVFDGVSNSETDAEVGTLTGQTEADATVTLLETGEEAIADENGQFSFDNLPLVLGTNVFTLTSTDAAGNQGQILRSVTRVASTDIPAENQAPQIVSGPTEELLLGQTYRSRIEAIDNDGDPLSYELLSGPTGLTLDGETGELVWEADAVSFGNHIVRIRVSDGQGGVTEGNYTLRTTDLPPNRPPIFTSTPVVDAFIDQPYVYDADAIDPDNDDLTYSVVRGPEGLTVNPDSGLIEWVPPQGFILGDRVFGQINTPGERDIFTFDGVAGQRVYMDPQFFTGSSDDWNVTLIDPNGQEVIYTDLNYKGTGWRSLTDQQLWTLQTDGQYQIVVDIDSDKTGSYGFTLIDIQQTPFIALDTPVKNTFNSGTKDHLYRFSGTEGQKIFADLRLESYQRMTWLIYSLNGDVIGRGSSGDIETTLPIDGEYVLAIRGGEDISTGFNYEFELVTPDEIEQSLELGTNDLPRQISSELSEKGETDIYTFEAEAGQRILFDVVSPLDNGLSGIIYSPSGNRVPVSGGRRSDDHQFTYSSYYPEVLGETGTYRFVIDAYGETLGQYGFSILDVDAAPNADFGVLNTGVLEAGDNAHVYQVQGKAGQRLAFDLPDYTSRISWTLYSSGGEPLEVDTRNREDFEYVLPRDDDYTLVISGRSEDIQSYEFTVLDKGVESSVDSPSVGVRFEMGTSITGSVSEVDEVDTYTFSGLPGQLLYLDDLGTDDFWLGATLSSPTGRELSQIILNGDSDAPILLPEEGIYTLEVASRGSSHQEDYSFRLLDLTASSTIALEDSVSGGFDEDGDGATSYQFTGVEGQRLFIEQNANSQYQIFDRGGESELYVAGETSDREWVIPADGNYFLVNTARSSSTGDDAIYDLSLLIAEVTTEDINLGQTVSGAIATPGEQSIYTFTGNAGQQLYFDSLSGESSLTVSLLDNYGKEIWSQSANSDRNPFTLETTADYQLVVDGTDEKVGNYGFRILDVASQPTLELELGTSSTLDFGAVEQQTNLYRLDLDTEARLYFEDIGQGYDDYVLYGPTGEVIFSDGIRGGRWSDHEINIEIPGIYTLALQEDGNTEDGDGVTVHWTQETIESLALGSLVTGAVDSPGDRKIYEFTGTTGQLLHIDNLLSNSNLDARLISPTGQILLKTDLYWTNRNIAGLTLTEDGQYRLEIDGDGSGTGNYQLNISDRAEASPLELGVTQTDTVTAAASNLYRIDGLAGQVLDFSWLTRPSGASWFLYDPGNQNITSSSQGDFSVTLPTAGIYTLGIEGSSNADLTYEFQVDTTGITVPEPEPNLLGGIVANQIVSGSVDGSETEAYLFEGEIGQTILFDGMFGSAGATLYSPNDEKIFSSNSRYGFRSEDHGFHTLDQSGIYRLVIDGKNDGANDYSFQILDPAQAQEITLQTPVSLNFESQQQGQLFRFSGEANQSLYFDSQPISGISHRWRLYRDDNGFQDRLFDSSFYYDVDNIVLPEDGDYILHLVGGYSAEPLNTEFQIWSYDESNTQGNTLLPGSGISDSDSDSLLDLSASIKVEDGFGGTAIQDYRISLNPNPQNISPQIVSTPITSIAPDQEIYEYRIEVLDPDSEEFSFRLIDGPLGAFISQDSGVLGWSSDSIDLEEEYYFEIEVKDDEGGRDTQSFTVTPTQNLGSIRGAVFEDINNNGLRDTSFIQGDEPNLLFIVDTSLSIGGASSAWVRQGFDALYDPDVKLTTLQDRERASFIALLENLALQGRDEGIDAALFRMGTPPVDMDRETPGLQPFVRLSDDDDNNGVPDYIQAWNQLTGDGSSLVTQSDIDHAIGLARLHPEETLNIIFLSDGGINVDREAIAELRNEPNVNISAAAVSQYPGLTVGDEVLAIDPEAQIIFEPYDYLNVFGGWGDSSDHEPLLEDITVYLDLNNNGQIDEEEPFQLTTAPDDSVSLSTAADPFYFNFENLLPGTYTLRQVIPAGFEQTVPTDVFVDEITITEGENHTHLFGLHEVGDPPNAAPEFITTAPSALIAVGESFRYSGLAIDPDADEITYDLTLAPEGVVVNPESGVVAWTPEATQAGETVDILLRARDNRGAQSVQAFQVTVDAPNQAPVFTTDFNGLPSPQANKPFGVDIQAIDPDGDGVTYRLLDDSSGAEIDADTGRLTWTAGRSDLGEQLITVAATDGEDETQQTIALTVIEAQTNQDAEIASEPEPRSNAQIGAPYTYTIPATDPDGDRLTYRVVNPSPAEVTVDDNGRVLWVPTPEQFGTQMIAIEVDDGQGGSQVTTWSVDVSNQATNEAPVITSTPPAITNLQRSLEYQLQATDPDGDSVLWLLDEAPDGAVLDPLTGVLHWQPGTDQLGDRDFVVRALDSQGESSSQAFTVQVNSVNTPPAITSVPPTEIGVPQTYRYGVEATDPEGDTVRFGLGAAPDGVVIDELTGELTWDTPVQGSHDIEVIARDEQSGSDRQQYTVQVGETAVNQGPTITSNPSLSVGVGNDYTYQVAATDPEGDRLTYELAEDVTGAELDPDTGTLTWTPATAGAQQFDILARDPSGAVSGQRFTVTAVEDEAPVVESFNPPTSAVPNTLYQYTVVARDPNGTRLTYTLNEDSVAAGVTIDNQGRLRWTPTEELTGDLDITLTITDESGTAVTETFTVTVDQDNTAPIVELLPLTPVAIVDDNTFQVRQGDTVRFQVAATDDVGVTGTQLFVGETNEPVALDRDGIGELTAEQGTLTLKGWATDAAGNTGETEIITLDAVNSDDNERPEVFLDPTAFENPITTFTDIVGYAHDPNGTLDYYTLSVAPANVENAEFVEILRVEGEDVESAKTLSQFDPTTLQNDSYRLRLTAVDQGRNSNTTEIDVEVRGELKLGNFQLSFTDLEIPVAGIPISVTRTYDTLTANEKDDFGFGWRLEFRDTNLRTSLREPSPEEKLLERYPGFNDGDRVYVTMPGGRRVGFTFEAKLDPRLAASNIALPAALQFRNATFVPDDGVEAELTVASPSLTYNDSVGAYTGINGIPFNPLNQTFSGVYTLTTKEGIQYNIDAETGDLSSATDLNGNTLTFSDTGIVSDTGVAVTFERDESDRITKVIDPEGNKIVYGYNEAGDLISVTDGKNSDGEDIKTEFVYNVEDRPHYLNEIVDPLGRSGVRTEYDEQGRLKRTVDVNGEAVVIDYDSENSVQTVKDIYGEPTTYVYDDRGNVLTEVDPIGQTIERTYDEEDNVLSETLITVEDGVEQRRTTSYTYDDEGNQLTVTNNLNQTSRSVYGEYGRLLSESDALGNTTTYQYDDRGNLTQTQDAIGNITKFEYDRRGNLTTLTDANDQSTTFVYNRRGDVESTEDADGNITTYEYDGNGLRSRETQFVTTANGVEEVVTQLFYDDAERLDYRIDAEGNRTDYKYDDNGNQIEVIDGRGHSTQSVYDEKNQLVETIYPDATPDDLSDNTRTVTVFDKGDRRRAVIDELGRVTHFVYDAGGRMVETIYPTDADTLEQFIGVLETRDGEPVTGDSLATVDWTDVVYPIEAPGYLSAHPRTQTEYFKTGEVKAEIDERGNRTEFRYDQLGRVVETIYADDTPDDLTDNPRSSSTYDAAGRQVSTTDTLNRTTTQVYDDLGRVTETRFADDTTTQTEYDNLGRRTASVDALGRRTEFNYDDLGRLTDVLQFLDGREIRTEYGYDELGRQLFQEDANDNRTSFTYDLLGRRTSVTLPEDQVSSSTYDENGNLKSYTDFNGEVMTYTYDEQNRLTFLDLEDDADVTYTYTLNGLQNSISDGRGTTAFTYDSRNRLIAQTDPVGPYTPDGASLQYQYDLAGNRTQVRTPGGVTNYSFDERNRLETVTDSEQGATTYSYDSESNLIETTLPNAIVETRTYDDLNRLTQIEQKDGETVVGRYQYELNEVGNRESVTEADGRRVDYQYDDLDRLIQETITDPGSTNDGRTYSYTYDDVGNRIRRVDSIDGTTTYSYDDNDRLLEEVANGVATVYTYDDNGNTLTQTVDGQAPTTYTWDDRNRLVTVNTPDGDVIAYEYDDENIRVSSTVNDVKTTYVVDSNRPYHQVLEEYEDSNIKARYIHGLDLISIEQDEQTSIYLVDGLGSTRTLTDIDGNVIATYDYDAYGELIDSTGTADNDYLFTGEQFDNNLDQYYLRQRFYSSSSGRFSRRDTYEGVAARPRTLHKYNYTSSNPINGIDPTGLFTMTELNAANSIRNELASIQVDFGANLVEAAGGSDHPLVQFFDQVSAARDFITNASAILSFAPALGAFRSKNRKVPDNNYPWSRYQKHVTRKDYEETWTLEHGKHSGRTVQVDGSHSGHFIEVKWTGKNPAAWKSSPYNPNHRWYDLGKTLDQTERYLQLNREVGGNGVIYAFSELGAVSHYTQVFQSKFPKEVADGNLRVVHVPGNGM